MNTASMSDRPSSVATSRSLNPRRILGLIPQLVSHLQCKIKRAPFKYRVIVSALVRPMKPEPTIPSRISSIVICQFLKTARIAGKDRLTIGVPEFKRVRSS